MTRRLLTLACSLYLGGVFLYAAYGKILEPRLFAQAVYNYQMLPVPVLANLFAVTLPWVELACGLALVTGFLRREGALLATALLLLFLAAIGIAMARGLNTDCGCFTTSGEGRRVGWQTISEDLAWLLLALQILVSREGPPAPTGRPSESLSS